MKVTEWPKGFAGFGFRGWSYNYGFGQSRTRVCVRISFRSYVCACTQQFGLWFGFMFRVRVPPALQRGTFKVGIVIDWYSDLHTALIEFDFSIMIGLRIRVVFKIWVFAWVWLVLGWWVGLRLGLKFGLD